MGTSNAVSIDNFPGWTALTTMTAAVTTPGVAARKYEDLQALAGVQIFEPDAMHKGIELRFSGTTDADSLVFDLLAARGQGDDFDRVATLTCTVGTQQRASATNLYVDTIAITEEKWLKQLGLLSAADDYIARVAFDRCGYKSFALVPTTHTGTVVAEYSGIAG
ncbi:MAG: hypothetical protein GY832_31670 [Chloroflexi bacterium]|nr:hypothetical protein [Chloroflexota bacterium]